MKLPHLRAQSEARARKLYGDLFLCFNDQLLMRPQRVTWDADYVSSGEDLPRTISPVRKTILRPFKVNGPVRKTSIIATSADSVQKRFDGVEVPHLKGWSADDIRVRSRSFSRSQLRILMVSQRLEGKGRRIDEDDDIEVRRKKNAIACVFTFTLLP